MEHLRSGRRFGAWRFGAFVLLTALVGLSSLNVRAETWTWTGLGCDNRWSTKNNWQTGADRLPSSDYRTTLIFDGSYCLTPQQNLYGKFCFGALVFTNTAGAFVLDGTTNVTGLSGSKSWQFSGSQMPCVRVLTANGVTIAGPVLSVDGTENAPRTSLVEVAVGSLLQLPTILGGVGDVVTKRGAGMLRVYETEDGLRYACNDPTVGPEWRIEDGVVELGVRTNRFLFANSDTKGTNWVRAANHTKGSYNLTVGDGLGSATSAVLRLIGQAQRKLLDNYNSNAVVFVQSDGWLDFNGVQNWDQANCRCFSICDGRVRLGGSSLFVRPGMTLDLRGCARLEGDGLHALVYYDGATNVVDGLATSVVLAADAAFSNVTANPAGVVFQVAGHTGDVAALVVTGHLGAGGAGSHLIKRGVGTMSMGRLTHAVRTNYVEHGTLLLNGLSKCVTAAAGSQWLVMSNATLGGAGTISNATVVLQGGTLDPGTADIGTMTIASNLVLKNGATLVFDLAGTDAGGYTNDQLVIRHGVLSGLSNTALRIDVPDHLPLESQTFRFINGGGNLTGQTFRSVTVTGRPARRADVTAGDGFVDVRVRRRIYGTVLILK